MRSLPFNAVIRIILICTVVLFLVYSVSVTRDPPTVTVRTAKPVTIVNNDMKYILLWTPSKCDSCAPFHTFGEGRYSFTRRQCPHNNCYITTNRTLVGDYRNFDAVLFNGRQILTMTDDELPSRRSDGQLYVFVQLESPDRFPVCNQMMDNFFNRTFTYRLDSDYLWPYLQVSLLDGTVIGPAKDIQWLKVKDMKPIDDEMKEKLRTKKKAAAWFVSNCNSRNNREQFAKNLTMELSKFNHTVDVYGKCGTLECSRNSEQCSKYVEEDYFFYLSLENSFSADYVTEKLMTALENDAVPIVYGAADYNRFLPPGSYLHGRELGADKLADKMWELMNNFTLYEDMFRWKNHYTYSMLWPPPMCEICADFHRADRKVKSYDNFREWWFPNFKRRC